MKLCEMILPAVTIGNTSWVDPAMSLSFDTEKHAAHRVAAFFFLVVYAFGIPVMFLGLLSSSRHFIFCVLRPHDVGQYEAFYTDGEEGEGEGEGEGDSNAEEERGRNRAGEMNEDGGELSSVALDAAASLKVTSAPETLMPGWPLRRRAGGTVMQVKPAGEVPFALKPGVCYKVTDFDDETGKAQLNNDPTLLIRNAANSESVLTTLSYGWMCVNYEPRYFYWEVRVCFSLFEAPTLLSPSTFCFSSYPFLKRAPLCLLAHACSFHNR